jgi:hypothetical protein
MLFHNYDVEQVRIAGVAAHARAERGGTSAALTTGRPRPLQLSSVPQAGRQAGRQARELIEAPWLVNGGHGASLRHHNGTPPGLANSWCLAAKPALCGVRQPSN